MRIALCALCAACFLLVGVSSIPAQTKVLKAEIPFDFQVMGKTLPAGNYLIDRLEATLPALVLSRINENKRTVVMPMNLDVGQDDRAYLTFDRIGDAYFLRTIKTGYLAAGYQFPKSKSEREMTARVGRSETVEMAATLR
jgi:hypothetical protein